MEGMDIIYNAHDGQNNVPLGDQSAGKTGTLKGSPKGRMVDSKRIELSTSALRTRRSRAFARKWHIDRMSINLVIRVCMAFFYHKKDRRKFAVSHCLLYNYKYRYFYFCIANLSPAKLPTYTRVANQAAAQLHNAH